MRVGYRPFQALALVLLAALVTGAAAFAPLYDRAMQQALTRLELARTPVAQRGLQLTAISDGSDAYGAASGLLQPEAVRSEVPASLRSQYDPAVLAYAGSSNVVSGMAGAPLGRVVWRSDACAHVTVVAGRCADGAGQLDITPADARFFGVGVGQRLELDGALLTDGRGGGLLRMQVVGIVRQSPDVAYWGDVRLTGHAGVPGEAPDTIQHDTWLTGRASFEQQPGIRDTVSEAWLPLGAAAVDVGGLHRLSTALGRLETQLRLPVLTNQIRVATVVPSVEQEVRHETRQARVTVPLLMAQLVLLALVVLWLVLMAVTEQRRPEVALARLRGRGRGGAVAYLLGELLTVVLAGLVPGALLAVLAAAVARRLLPGSAPFELTTGYVVAVAAAAVVLIVATLLASVRTAREPLEVLLRRVPPRRSAWGLGVAEALVVAGCGGVVLGFVTGSLHGPLALAAPGLLAIVVGLLLAHLVTPVASRLGRRLLRRGRLRSGLAVVDAARNPATRRTVTVVTLATALAVFAGDAVLVGARNRDLAAEQVAGAPVVALVDGDDLPGLRRAVTAFDHGRRVATPVVATTPPGLSTGGSLAVDPAAFARVALLPPGTATDIARLRPPAVTPIRVTGTRLSMDVADSSLVARGTDRLPTSVDVGLDLVASAGEVLHATFGTLDGPLAHRRLATTVLACRNGCSVAGIWVTTVPGAVITGEMTLSRLAGRGRVSALGPRTRWVDQDTGPSGVGDIDALDAGDPQAVVVSVKSRGGETLTLGSRWAPSQVAAVASPPVPAVDANGGFTTTGIDGGDQRARAEAVVPRIPGGRRGTVVFDLDVVTRTRQVSADAQLEVWLTDPRLLGALRSALEARDLSVATVTTLAEARGTYAASTATWSLQLALVVGLAALLLAALVLVVGAASAWRTRTRDLAALRMSGVSRRTVAGVVVAAQLPAVVAGLVAGTVAGLAGARLSLPIVPLFPSAPEVSTLDLSTDWGGAAIAVAAAALVLLGTAVAMGRSLARRSGVRRLRESV